MPLDPGQLSWLAQAFGYGDPEASGAAANSTAMQPVIGSIPQGAASGSNDAISALLGAYARALNPAIMKEPFGAWQRLGALGIGAPAGSLAEGLAVPGLARTLSGGAGASEAGRLMNQSAVVAGQLAPQRPSQGYFIHDPYTGAFVDPQGQRWY